MDKAKALAKSTSVSGSKGEYAGSAGSGRQRTPATLELRTFDVALEVRDDGDGRTLIGRAVPYGETINLPGDGGRERFVAGAFARQVEGGPTNWGQVKLFDSHSARMSGAQPIGKTAMLAERQDGLHGAWPLYRTTKANDALELVRSGEVTGLSIGFKVNGRPQIGADGAYERTAAHLDHIVLTHEPVYPSAAVTAVRSVHPIAGFRVAQARAHAIIDRLGLPL
jgi:HK97 family phage prohead protease